MHQDCIDDPTNSDTEILWRYVHPSQVAVDQTTGKWRPASGVFMDKSHRMSCDRASQTDLATARGRNPGKFIAQFTVKIVREMGKSVTQKIDVDPDNPAHTVVCPKLTATEARRIASQANVWVDGPPIGFVPPKQSI